ncbi:hypothetical protein CAPTEDRAFT_185728 [Capitella teleta]|uniref:Uncharacterized protein n=1 Tax=Capitella teleta TaxID=283909 RepID=R7VI91_CAPTE|nr:hypothetical protein CAPTEDRAFT_185728 [Capitella teleta]|eukprot:ELU18252.1 hypothetical protein CAPTEDRAFT_185728 [Capitella teleta]
MTIYKNNPRLLHSLVPLSLSKLTNVYTITSPFPKLPQLSLLVNSTIDVSIFHQSSSSLHLLSRRLEAGRSPCNKAQQLSSFESEQEHGKRRCTPPVYFKDYDTDVEEEEEEEGLDLCPESSRWTCRCPQHIQPRKEKDLEEDASFHRPAPVMSEDED